ncbi:hypothetical protein GQ55_8G200200 [Panicum hallii var. hallii]|uniref:Uncharacterized protein n=1 Tax=Panicum hallii var. hallii TaxID=1504633 RepID=A0A2T7CPB7_9POAL|nr:hypothetical protein GQ55_8G200200 [Panicum hallii var. hallii]
MLSSWERPQPPTGILAAMLSEWPCLVASRLPRPSASDDVVIVAIHGSAAAHNKQCSAGACIDLFDANRIT